MMLRAFLCFLMLAGMAQADTDEPGTMCSDGAFGQVQCIRPSHFVFDTCQAIEAFAKDSNLDPGFFARLIWQESRFDPNALSHANARGIAQFIPSTAKLRGLRDPYNPAQALEYSAEYLGDMSVRFGNHGLAAIGYNGGERRAKGLMAGTGGLARETVNYVKIITGFPAEVWAHNPPKTHDYRLQKDKPFQQACYELARKRKLSKYPPLEPPEPKLKKWGVQMAFGVTKKRALAQYKERSRRCSAAVKGEKPDLVWQKSRASPKGGYFMARIGRNSRDSAWKLCRRLKSSGCICAVYRNR
ncbi:lytic transglycosylase domain-containing protein [uncultured Pelagimonas sp.]|uniref:lytic transglycosylase domain-containing protein n=1 Tax=uncultured Pelagimonas sp. TaxID=1618102 RepID=UPI00343DD998